MSDVTLGLSNRANLLALKSTQSLLDRTSNRLSTGRKVDKPIDNARAFFSSEALLRVARNFTTGQNDIQQTSNTIDAAIAGLKSITKLVETAQGIVTSLSVATTAAQSAELAGQYNQILAQIDNLATTTSYQGINLIGATATTLNVSYRGVPGVNDIAIVSQRSDSFGLTIATQATGAFFNLTLTAPSLASRASVASLESIAAVAARAAINASPSAQSTQSVASVDSSPSYASIAALGAAPSQSSVQSNPSIASLESRASVAAIAASVSSPSLGSVQSVETIASTASAATRSFIIVGGGVNTALVATVNTALGNALAALSARQSTLGAVNGILAVRLEFSQSYVAIQQQGASQLTTADLNEESANLTSLQTAQSLGVVSLSISSQAQQSLLRLF